MNQGRSPASIANYHLIVETGGETIAFEHERLSDPKLDPDREQEALKMLRSLRFSNVKPANESLAEQTLHAMPQGEPAVGFLRFDHVDDLGEKLKNKSGIIRVSFEDSQGQHGDTSLSYRTFIGENTGLTCEVM